MAKRLKNVTISSLEIKKAFEAIRDDKGFSKDSTTLAFLVRSYQNSQDLKKQIINLKLKLKLTQK